MVSVILFLQPLHFPAKRPCSYFRHLGYSSSCYTPPIVTATYSGSIFSSHYRKWDEKVSCVGLWGAIFPERTVFQKRLSVNVTESRETMIQFKSDYFSANSLKNSSSARLSGAIERALIGLCMISASCGGIGGSMPRVSRITSENFAG